MVVGLLVRGEYEVLHSMTGGRWLTAKQMRDGVVEYGRTLVAPPATAWNDIDAVQADGVDPATFHVVMPLWTLEEGMSDLSLELRLIETYPDALDVEITSIHVL